MHELLFLNVIGISAVTGILVLALVAMRMGRKKRTASKWMCICWVILALRLLILIKLPIALYEIEVPDGIEAIAAENTALYTDISAASDENAAAYTQRTDWLGIAVFIWLVGMVVFFVCQIVVYIATRKKILRWSRLASDEVMKKAEGTAVHLGVKQRFSVLVCAERIPPMLMGVLSPKLFLPAGIEGQQLEIALRHELTHLRRRDIIFKMLMTAANAVHWFNPIVYLMVREAERDAEWACDEAVLYGVDQSTRRAYCSTILDMMHSRRIPFATALTYKKEDIMKRFENILDSAKRRSGIVMTLILICASVLICGLVGCAEKDEPANQNEEVPYVGMTENEADEVSDNEIFSWDDGYADAERAMELINEYRQQNGLPSITVDDGKLREIAEKRLEEIQESFSHTRPNGERYISAFEDAELEFTYACEKLGRGHKTAGELMNNWIDAEVDRGVLLSPDITHMYVACCEGEYDGIPYMYWIFLAYAP